jgi:hypothetical protein
VLSGHDDGSVRATRLGTDGQVGAVTSYGEYLIAARGSAIAGRNPGMWPFLFPSPGARAETAKRAEALAAWFLEQLAAPDAEQAARPSAAPDPVARAIDRLWSADAATRFWAARELGEAGDRRALAPLEGLVLRDTGSFSVEGGYVDRLEHVHLAAAEALAAACARLEPDDSDRRRLAATLAWAGGCAARVESVFEAWGGKARAVAAAALDQGSPTVRVRARNIMAMLDRQPAHGPLADPDEDVRFAATEQDEYTPRLMAAALRRWPDEPSLRVRRGILDLWIRLQRRLGRRADARECAALPFAADADETVRTRFARFVRETAR